MGKLLSLDKAMELLLKRGAFGKDAIKLAEKAALKVVPAALPWMGGFWGWCFKIMAILGVWETVRDVVHSGLLMGATGVAEIWPDSTGRAIAKLDDEMDGLLPIGESVSAHIFDKLFNDLISGENIINSMKSGAPGAFFDVSGNEYGKIFDFLFNTDGVKADFVGRTSTEHSLKNFRRVMGANVSLSMRAHIVASVAHMFPLGPLKHVADLQTSVIQALGFNRMAHTMTSVIASNLVHKGVDQRFKKLIKPQDMTEGETYRATIAGLIPVETRDQILDNYGHRDDIRPWITALTETDLPESVITEQWRQGLASRDQIRGWFRLKNFQVDRADRMTNHVVNGRTYELLDKITGENRSLFRDGVTTEDDFRSWLRQNHYSDIEQDLEVSLALLERKHRTFLSNNEIFNAVEKGLIDVPAAQEEMRFRGYTEEDLLIETILQLQKHLPKTCDQKLDKDQLIAVLQAIGTTAGVTGTLLHPGLIKYLQCLNALVPIVLPLAQITVSPNVITESPAEVVVTWKTTFATHQSINGGIGNVPASGKTIVKLHEGRGFTIIAHNPIGKTEATAFVSFQPPGFPPLPPAVPPPPPPTIDFFRVTPIVLDLPAKVHVEWQTTGATIVFIQPAPGPVAESGAADVLTSIDTMFSIRVANDGGSESQSIFVRVLRQNPMP